MREISMDIATFYQMYQSILKIQNYVVCIFELVLLVQLD